MTPLGRSGGGDARARAAITHALAAQMVRRVVELLPRGARVMPLKGTLTGRTLRDAPEARPMTDCDLLISDVSLVRALRSLREGGLRVVAWCSAPGVVVLVDPSSMLLALDLHSVPLMPGYGAVSTSWMFEGARADDTLFGARVFIPDDARLFVHLLASMLKDDLFRAQSALVEDIALLLSRHARDLDRLAAALAEARLTRAGYLALERVATTTAAAAPARRVQAALGLSPRDLAWVQRRLRDSERWCQRATRPLAAKLAAHAVSDRWPDDLLCIVAGSAGWLHARARTRVDVGATAPT